MPRVRVQSCSTVCQLHTIYLGVVCNVCVLSPAVSVTDFLRSLTQFIGDNSMNNFLQVPHTIVLCQLSQSSHWILGIFYNSFPKLLMSCPSQAPPLVSLLGASSSWSDRKQEAQFQELLNLASQSVVRRCAHLAHSDAGDLFPYSVCDSPGAVSASSQRSSISLGLC